jgi:predicted lipoprotein with Yx(FWY)xxD motif/plastocyanin
MSQTAFRIRRPVNQTLAVGGTLAALLLAAGCTAAASPSPAPTAQPTSAATAASSPAAGATVKVAQHPGLGAYLTGPDGRALYLFTKDARDSSTCTGQCAGNWPALTVSGSAAPTGDAGVSGTLATIARSDGGRQVTYNGVPLYFFAQDAGPGDTKGQGVNGVWFLAGTGTSAASGTITGGLGQGGGAAASPSPSTAAAAPSTAAAANTLQIRNSSFPSSITIAEGTPVTWVNADAEDHTVTADDGSFDSGNIAPGANYQRTLPAGTVKYHCTIHPEMTGTVIVTSAYVTY